ncbi:MAG: hypothetical protein ACJAQ5_001876 [Flavobacteriales bacterium]|jgi:hypothetical protein
MGRHGVEIEMAWLIYSLALWGRTVGIISCVFKLGKAISFAISVS